MVEWRMTGGRPSLAETLDQGTASWGGRTLAGLSGTANTKLWLRQERRVWASRREEGDSSLSVSSSARPLTTDNSQLSI